MLDEEAGKFFLAHRPTFLEWKRFARIWDRLARRGSCDARGGAEYRRVVIEWINAGKPRGMSAFIRERANLGPGDQP